MFNIYKKIYIVYIYIEMENRQTFTDPESDEKFMSTVGWKIRQNKFKKINNDTMGEILYKLKDVYKNRSCPDALFANIFFFLKNFCVKMKDSVSLSDDDRGCLINLFNKMAWDIYEDEDLEATKKLLDEEAEEDSFLDTTTEDESSEADLLKIAQELSI